mmetsp:Transcript_24673/g.93302  ORF Transcript_24673/g.93302 Transcript_24673/m.93302 type:complete len:266 (+) Transcript_24673:226-1023(+)
MRTLPSQHAATSARPLMANATLETPARGSCTALSGSRRGRTTRACSTNAGGRAARPPNTAPRPRPAPDCLAAPESRPAGPPAASRATVTSSQVTRTRTTKSAEVPTATIEESGDAATAVTGCRAGWVDETSARAGSRARAREAGSIGSALQGPRTSEVRTAETLPASYPSTAHSPPSAAPAAASAGALRGHRSSAAAMSMPARLGRPSSPRPWSGSAEGSSGSNTQLTCGPRPRGASECPGANEPSGAPPAREAAGGALPRRGVA